MKNKGNELDVDSIITKLADFSRFIKQEQKKFAQDIVPIDLTHKAYPFAILFLADLHIGSIYTDYDEFLAVKSFIQKNKDKVFVGLCGDIIDNFDNVPGFLQRVGIDSQVVPPSVQRVIFQKILKEVKDVTIGYAVGNHEEFSSLEYIFEQACDFPIGLNRLCMKLALPNNESYIIAMVHKGRFNSYLNPTHTNLRELQKNYPFANAIVTSHTHFPATHEELYPSEKGIRPIVFLKCGTIKELDSYTAKYFNPYPVGEYSIPALVFTENNVTSYMTYRHLENIKGF